MSAAGSKHRRACIGRAMLTAAAAAALLFGLYRVVLHQAVALFIPYFTLQCRLQQAVLLFAGPKNEIRVETLHVRKFRPGEAMPRRLDSAAYGVTVPAGHPLMAPYQELLRMLGYTLLRGDLEIRWIRQGKGGQESWAVDLGLKVEKAGDASIALRLDKVNPQGVRLALETPFHWLLVLPAVELTSAACRYDDRGLFDRGLAATARAQGKRPQDVRATLTRDLHERAQKAQDPGVRAFWRTLADFSRHSAGMAFETRLSEPLPLGRLLWMRTPADVVRGLALASRAE